MEIDDDFRLHEGATADIRLGSNVGAVNRTVELTQGDTDRAEAGRGHDAAATRRPTSRSTSTIAVETLDPPTRANIKRFLIGLDDALKGRGADFDRTLRHSARGAQRDRPTSSRRSTATARRCGRSSARASGCRRRSPSSPGDLGEAAERTATLLDDHRRAARPSWPRASQLLGPALPRGRRALDALADATPQPARAGRGPRPGRRRARAVRASCCRRRPRPPGPFLDETRKLVERGPARPARASRPIVAAPRPAVARQLGPIARAGAARSARSCAPTSRRPSASSRTSARRWARYDANGHMLNLAAGLLPVAAARAPRRGGASARTTAAPGLLRKPFIRAPGRARVRALDDYRGQLHRYRRRRRADARRRRQGDGRRSSAALLVARARRPRRHLAARRRRRSEVVAEFQRRVPADRGDARARRTARSRARSGTIEVDRPGPRRGHPAARRVDRGADGRRDARRSASRTRTGDSYVAFDPGSAASRCPRRTASRRSPATRRRPTARARTRSSRRASTTCSTRSGRRSGRASS